MTSIGSWRFWVIVALALGTLACAGRAERRERKEEAREERRERAEARRVERQQRNEQRRAGRNASGDDEPKSSSATTPPPSTSKPTTATLTPVSTAPTAEVGESKMVFLRPSGMGGAVAATVFDVTGSGDAMIVGIIHMRGKLVYPMKPGAYTFMVVSEAADFMQVTVSPGKTYYALVSPRMGAWKARFSFTPLRGGDSRAEQWERSTRLQNNQARADSWMRDNASSVEDKRARWWPVWDGKPEAQKASQTLNAEDGR